MNSSGQVVGYSYTTGNVATHPFLYSNGKMQNLGDLGGGSGAAYGINASGEVVGYAGTSDNYSHAFLYSGGTMTDLGTLGGTDSEAVAINNSGQVVGDSYTAGNAADDPFLYSNGTMTDLNALIDPSSGWTLEFATAINDNGQIVGTGVNPSGQLDAFLLTPASPTPEPSTLVLLIASAVALLGRAWRRRRPWSSRVNARAN